MSIGNACEFSGGFSLMAVASKKVEYTVRSGVDLPAASPRVTTKQPFTNPGRAWSTAAPIRATCDRPQCVYYGNYDEGLQ